MHRKLWDGVVVDRLSKLKETRNDKNRGLWPSCLGEKDVQQIIAKLFKNYKMENETFIKVFLIHQLMHNWIVLKSILKFILKLILKHLPTCFGVITIISERLFDLAKVTFVKITN
jgi:hypothetical protein